MFLDNLLQKLIIADERVKELKSIAKRQYVQNVCDLEHLQIYYKHCSNKIITRSTFDIITFAILLNM